MGKYLITGAGGFIGGHLVKRLIDSGEEVRGRRQLNIDESELISIAKEIDPDGGESLARLFIEMLEGEKAAIHQARPQRSNKFTKAIDKEQGSV